MAIPLSKLRQMALLWFLALGLSAAMVAAGRRWPTPLTPASELVWSLLVVPPLAMLLALLGRWSLPPSGQEGQSEVSPWKQQR